MCIVVFSDINSITFWLPATSFLIIFIWYILFYLLNFNFCLSAYGLLCKQHILDCASFNSCTCAFMFVVIVDIFWTYFSYTVFSLFLNRAFSFILNN